LAGFLGVIDRLYREHVAGSLPPLGIRAIYVSPLRALTYDMRKNLHAPLAGLGVAETIRIASRTGDSTPAERAKKLSRVSRGARPLRVRYQLRQCRRGSIPFPRNHRAAEQPFLSAGFVGVAESFCETGSCWPADVHGFSLILAAKFRRMALAKIQRH
jgi:ATP-dependent helicase YprA (DUF1998 family)